MVMPNGSVIEVPGERKYWLYGFMETEILDPKQLDFFSAGDATQYELLLQK